MFTDYKMIREFLNEIWLNVSEEVSYDGNIMTN
jgi:hypothetical protein